MMSNALDEKSYGTLWSVTFGRRPTQSTIATSAPGSWFRLRPTLPGSTKVVSPTTRTNGTWVPATTTTRAPSCSARASSSRSAAMRSSFFSGSRGLPCAYRTRPTGVMIRPPGGSRRR